MSKIESENREKSNIIDEEYNESEDEDFNPNEVYSSSEDESSEAQLGKKRKLGQEPVKIDDSMEDSGTLFVKTRSQLKQESNEKHFSKIEKSKIDINEIWNSMSQSVAKEDNNRALDKNKIDSTKSDTKSVSKINEGDKTDKVDTILIKRTVEFAGEKIVEEKNVPKDSAEAKAYLNSIKNNEIDKKEKTNSIKKPLQPSIANRGLTRPRKRPSMLDSIGQKPIKMNTLEKSRLDWAKFVDKEGISEELKNQQKNGYLTKQEFLSKSEEKKYSIVQEARKKAEK